MIKREYPLAGRLAPALAALALGGAFATIFTGEVLQGWPVVLFLIGVLAAVFGVASTSIVALAA